MIFNTPVSWQDLQEKVCAIMKQVGFLAETNKSIDTPRGTVEIDVYADDPYSIDNIIYVTECKHWESKVSQTIIHAFTTVMHETGANIGYIISKNGFQKGSYNYTSNTNIRVFTFSKFQAKYLEKWFASHFSPIVLKEADSFIQYTEPINSRRSRFEVKLDKEAKQKVRSLMEKHTPFSYILLAIASHAKPDIAGILPIKKIEGISDFARLKEMLNAHSTRKFNSTCYADLLEELKETISEITKEFNDVFGKDIFKDFKIK